MRRYAILLVVMLVALSGCAPSPSLAVTLQAPGNGSTVPSLAPILAWTCTQADALYRIQVATDGSFQNLVIDESNLSGLSYPVPSGKLVGGESYYWRVDASKGGQTSGWSAYWTFRTQAVAGTIEVKATLDGTPWSGGVSYTVSGPVAKSGSSAPGSFSDLSAGTYTLSYSSGGPSGATLASISPSPTGTLSVGGTITFTMNFQAQPTDTIEVEATLDGSPWSGIVNYNVYGPKAGSSSSVPDVFSSLPAGTYTLSYSSGGPAGATLSNISPSPTQTLSAGGTMTFTLDFYTQPTSTIMVNATLDGRTWEGNIRYNIHGPKNDSSYSVADTFTHMPAGTYTLNYRSGGPAGAVLMSITPSPTQTVPDGGTIIFTLNFHSEATGTIIVNATLDGAEWSGRVNYTIHGPYTDAYSRAPHTFANLPAGTYTLSYNSRGPTGAVLSSITPSPTQSLPTNGTIAFTMNFHAQASSGTIMVNATLDGSSWGTAIGSGTINYSIHGPKSDAGTSVPETFGDFPGGTYTLSYNSGGPIGATLTNISRPTQTLRPGGTITFTMNFHKDATGTVQVSATINGSPWSGAVKYTLAGPYVDSSHNVPDTFSGCPAGRYTLSYTSGGPEQTVLEGITPSPTQNLSAGGSITFTMEFVGVLLGPGPED